MYFMKWTNTEYHDSGEGLKFVLMHFVLEIRVVWFLYYAFLHHNNC